MYNDIEAEKPLDAEATVQADQRPRPEIKPRYLTTPDAAIHLSLSRRTLEKHRCYGTGPVYRKLGGKVVYAINDLDAWAALGVRRSTADPGVGIVHPAKPIAQTDEHQRTARKK